MHSHGNPYRDLNETSRRNAALQINAVSLSNLAGPASGEVPGAMLH
jgi:hypothetical protein